MPVTLRQVAHGDDAERLVDTLLADPSRADDIKDLLRRKLKSADAVQIAAAPRRFSQSHEDEDDMWDNVPV